MALLTLDVDAGSNSSSGRSGVGSGAGGEVPSEPASHLGRLEIVEAALRHAYTGLVPDVDVLEVMALAHRLGMEDCVVDCAALLCLIPREHIVHVLLGLHPLREHPVVDAAWAALQIARPPTPFSPSPWFCFVAADLPVSRAGSVLRPGCGRPLVKAGAGSGSV